MKVTTQETKVIEIDLLNTPINEWPEEARTAAIEEIQDRKRNGRFLFTSRQELVQDVEIRLARTQKLIDEFMDELK